MLWLCIKLVFVYYACKYLISHQVTFILWNNIIRRLIHNNKVDNLSIHTGWHKAILTFTNNNGHVIFIDCDNILLKIKQIFVFK